ncbi:ATP-grasp domain-containing protein [Umezakia ovalisporum]|uniref:ATP-grasp domain-containing protein n=2 Tax=Umezakia ovalisporum TaxID=75695 RepID=A0AA43KEL9_9CYAN|nr:ATP-grasp domain-containing protein [Umezakia ovalisporum]MDH6058107.1 ATP-grasp domain-containing protein [Umezakia ovalisporum FSS-43]MDH6063118.1 ATP-grasp domain-containing protein [Umezakia ovalisporum FSS-62]MDH6066650.1 ATP-grasp domain-containing protein [Umezakia ovalisporum APH033B]MDH6071598.1 ATP-grasp domain-containing protein [Umezakia ovalisporum CobakiLakeA]MDH6078249.1 ATP-grasp domain-containing protein [Umezakia ovalisporum FSS-45]
MAKSVSLSLAKSTTPSTDVRLKLVALFKTLGTLTLLLIALPFNGLIVLIALLWGIVQWPLRKKALVAADPRTVLVSGGKMTKALQLARCFHGAGHRVILIETHKYWLSGHKFSRAVSAFYTVPSPQSDPEGYIQSLVAIVKKEKVDFYVPVCSPVASYYDSLAKPALSAYCEVFHFDADITKMLDDKFAFTEQGRSLGLSVPKSFQITDPQQVINFDFSQETRKYILKNIAYDSVRRLNLTKLPCDTPEETAAFVNSLPISAQNPWIMQEFIPGKELCTHSTVRDGELRLHCCSNSSAFQINYQNVENPQIRQWVQQFVKSLGLTGQVSFDFIQAEDGTVYAIECNPRTHSAITMFYNHPGVADAYLGKTPQAAPVEPLANSKPTYWLYHEIWRLTGIRSWKQLQTSVNTLVGGTDAIFCFDDPVPFLTLYHWQIPLLLLKNLQDLKGWVKIDFNIGKLVELDGD